MIATALESEYIGFRVIGSALAPRDNLTSGPTVRFPIGRALPDSGASGAHKMHIKEIPDSIREELRAVVQYDPDSGVLTWTEAVRCRWARSRCTPGAVVGTLHDGRYLRFQYKGHRHMVHRLIWELHNGEIPAGRQVDHIDGDRGNNRLENLRLVEHHINCQNQHSARSDNTSGFLGVQRGYFSKRHGQRWRAVVQFLDQESGRMRAVVCGSNHATPEAAHQAYIEAKRRLHPGCTI